MQAPLKVLIGFTAIAVALTSVVFYRYDIIGGIKRTANEPTETLTNTTTESSTPPTAMEISTQASVSKKESPSSSASLANGKKLYEEKTCVLCHGANGKADTPTGQAMKATNLTSGKFNNNKNNLEPVAYILNVIDNGVPGTAMVSFKAQIPNEQDRKDLAHYVFSLSKK